MYSPGKRYLVQVGHSLNSDVYSWFSSRNAAQCEGVNQEMPRPRGGGVDGLLLLHVPKRSSGSDPDLGADSSPSTTLVTPNFYSLGFLQACFLYRFIRHMRLRLRSQTRTEAKSSGPLGAHAHCTLVCFAFMQKLTILAHPAAVRLYMEPLAFRIVHERLSFRRSSARRNHALCCIHATSACVRCAASNSFPKFRAKLHRGLPTGVKGKLVPARRWCCLPYAVETTSRPSLPICG